MLEGTKPCQFKWWPAFQFTSLTPYYVPVLVRNSCWMQILSAYRSFTRTVSDYRLGLWTLLLVLCVLS